MARLVERLPLAQSVIPGSWDLESGYLVGREPASPSPPAARPAVLALSLTLSDKQTNK